MTGHRLGAARHHRDGTRPIYAASCECGTTVYGPTLPLLWQNHDQHLAVVRAQSRRNHPTWRQP